MFFNFKYKNSQSRLISFENELLKNGLHSFSPSFLHSDNEQSAHIFTPLEILQQAEIKRLKQQIAQLETAYKLEMFVNGFCDCPGRIHLRNSSIYELSDLPISAKNLLKNCRGVAEHLQKNCRKCAGNVQDLENVSTIIKRIVSTDLLRSFQK